MDTVQVRFVMIHTGSCISFTLRCDNHKILRSELLKISLKNSYQTKGFFDFNGPFTSQGYLVNDAWAMQNLPSFKTILTHPFLTGEKSPNRPKTVAEALKLIAS